MLRRLFFILMLVVSGLSPALQAQDALPAGPSAFVLIARLHALPGQADQVITKAVEEHDIDLLVMGAYGHSRIRNLIIGSTTSEMVRSCKIPVVLVR